MFGFCYYQHCFASLSSSATCACTLSAWTLALGGKLFGVAVSVWRGGCSDACVVLRQAEEEQRARSATLHAFAGVVRSGITEGHVGRIDIDLQGSDAAL